MAADKTSSASSSRVLLPGPAPRTIPIIAFGSALSLFTLISYVICVIGYLLFPSLPINHAALSIFLPGFKLLSWWTFCLGLFESFAYGWYVALIFGPLYNFFVCR